MPVYLISYDLNKPGQNYQSVLQSIKSYPDHIKILDSAYLVNTTHNASQIHQTIRTAFDQTDRFLINHLDQDYSGWLDGSVINWLKARM